MTGNNVVNIMIMSKRFFKWIATILLLLGVVIFASFAGSILTAWGVAPFGSAYQNKAIVIKERVRTAREEYYLNGIIPAMKLGATLVLEELNRPAATDDQTILTGLHEITVDKIDLRKYLDDFFKTDNRAPGYIDFLSDKDIVLATGDGRLLLLDKSSGAVVPLQSNLVDYLKAQKYPERRFGIRDIFFDHPSSSLYVSYYDRGSDGCYSMAIAKASLDPGIHLKKSKAGPIIFNRFYKSETCSLNATKNMWASGGRIKRLDEKHIVFTVGSYGADELDLPELDKKLKHYGEILVIDESGNGKVIADGFRNPEGLDILNGTIVVSDSGPKGGDEIDIVTGGANYGWPLASYGLSYSNEDIYKHPHAPAFEEPAFYFAPSIASSEILFYSGPEFPRWKGCLIVSGLTGKSIYRLHYDENRRRFISAEQIKLGYRIRDIQVDSDGVIWALADEGALLKIHRGAGDSP